MAQGNGLGDRRPVVVYGDMQVLDNVDLGGVYSERYDGDGVVCIVCLDIEMRTGRGVDDEVQGISRTDGELFRVGTAVGPAEFVGTAPVVLRICPVSRQNRKQDGGRQGDDVCERILFHNVSALVVLDLVVEDGDRPSIGVDGLPGAVVRVVFITFDLAAGIGHLCQTDKVFPFELSSIERSIDRF